MQDPSLMRMNLNTDLDIKEFAQKRQRNGEQEA